MAGQGRLPIHDARHVKARDTQVLEREEFVHNRDGLTSVRCPCNICIGEVHSKRKRDMVRVHLEEVGRYPYLRGRTRVRTFSLYSGRIFPSLRFQFHAYRLFVSLSGMERSRGLL